MKRALIVRLTALGDVVLVEPVVRALRAAYPGVQIDLLTEARVAVLGAEAFGVDRLIGWDRRGADRGLGGLSRVRARLAPEGYDLLVDLQNKLRTRLLAARVPAGQRLVLRKRGAAKTLLALFGSDPPIHDRHTVDLYLSALEPLALPSLAGEARAPRLHGLRRARTPGAPPRVGLAPAASHPTKQWPAERFAQLASGLDAELVLIGGPADRPVLEQVRSGAPGARFLELDVAATDVLGLAQTLAGLDLLISVDTGPAHLSAALGVPTVVIFGPTSPVRWGPIGAEHRVISLGLDCAPCSNVGGERCPRPDRAHRCMLALEVSAVLEAARERLTALGLGR